MKHPLSLLLTPLIVAMALLTGCASGGSRIAHLESLLAASGFRVVPATTDEELQQVQTLPKNTITKVNRRGKEYYIFPDSTQKQLYIGTADQYQDFLTRREIEKNAEADNRAAEESLRNARTESSANWDNAWGNWTGTGGY
ncbi:MAG: hypothetical protein RLZ45_1890 [Verrucomicrobiota bacterium]|jgi:hypothetical protein